MKTWWILAFLAALPAAAGAQETKGKAGEQKVAFEKRAFPFEGEVAADNLNVRMFPKSDQTSIITSVLRMGDKVTVVGEKDDFFQILPPKGSLVWVAARNVKRDGAVGTATANEVPVRLDSRVNADQVCSLKEGEQVRIVSENMGWFKIEAPASVKYFVGRKYVRAGAAIVKDEPKKRTAPAPDADAALSASLRDADAELERQKKLVEAQRLDEVDFSGVVAAYQGALEGAKTEPVKAEAQRGLQRVKDLQIAWLEWKRRKAEIDLKVAQETEKLKRTAPAPVKEFAMMGYVDTVGLIVNRPGTHKLVMGGKIVCFLRVKDGDDKMPSRMNDLYQKYVGVNGTVIKNPEGWDGYTVVVVEDIVPIAKE